MVECYFLTHGKSSCILGDLLGARIDGGGIMAESIEEGWHTHTVIDKSELEEYLHKISSDSDGRLEVQTHCVAVGGDTIDSDALIEFASEKFPYLVFPEDEVEERFPEVYRDALAKAGLREDAIRDGLYGELLLFLLVEGLLDLPMISHKIAGKQNPTDEVKGSDGLFFGEFHGEDALGIGEAKFFTNRNAGIRDSLESTDRFHGSGGASTRNHELEVATNNLSDNLSQKQIEELAERLTANTSDYRLVHPIFVGYEEDELNRLQAQAADGNELEETLFKFLEDSSGTLEYVQDHLKEYEELQKHWLVFILLPVEDSDSFKQRLRNRIFFPWRTG